MVDYLGTQSIPILEPKGMLAVPMNTYHDYHYDEDGRYHYEYQWISKLMIVNISEDEMQIHGEVNHLNSMKQRITIGGLLQYPKVNFHGRLHLCNLTCRRT